MKLKPSDNIWCCRRQNVWFLISRIQDHGEKSWYIVFLGYEFWIGPNRPGFLNRHYQEKKK